MLMQNISVLNCLMSNIKVIVKEIRRRFVVVQTIRDQRQVLIPRIIFRFALPRSGLTVDRRQFPLCLCYAMTVNKSQGQTLVRVCMDLQEKPFAHGQLYVASDCVRKGSDIHVLPRAAQVDETMQ